MPETAADPTEEQIAELARKFWEEEGQPEGKAEEHWTRAEEQIRNGGTSGGSNGDSAPA